MSKLSILCELKSLRLVVKQLFHRQQFIEQNTIN